MSLLKLIIFFGFINNPKTNAKMTELGGLVLFGVVAALAICCAIGVVYCACRMIYIRMTRPAEPLSKTDLQTDLQV